MSFQGKCDSTHYPSHFTHAAAASQAALAIASTFVHSVKPQHKASRLFVRHRFHYNELLRNHYSMLEVRKDIYIYIFFRREAKFCLKVAGVDVIAFFVSLFSTNKSNCHLRAVLCCFFFFCVLAIFCVEIIKLQQGYTAVEQDRDRKALLLRLDIPLKPRYHL